VPHLAAWALNQINGALTAAGSGMPTLGVEQKAALVSRMAGEGVMYDGLHILGGGSILGGLVLGAIAVFIIERELMKAAAFSIAGALMTFFGFMHGEQIGVAQTPAVAAAYVAMAAVLAGCSKFAVVPAGRPQVIEHDLEAAHGEGVPA
jgi:AGZA family xanthine/uracil permease-like MFS transporter